MKLKFLPILLFAVALFASTVARGQSAATVTIQANQPGMATAIDALGNPGGWGNTKHGIEMNEILVQQSGSIETGRWYDIRVQVKLLVSVLL